MREIIIILSIVLINVINAQNETEAGELGVVERQPKLGLFGSTANTLTTIAQDLFTRSATSSQVLSLNITNLVILLVIKALIFGAGSLGFGGSDQYGRSIKLSPHENLADEPLVSQSELLLMLGYLKGDINQNYNCFNFAVCNDPRKAKQYLLVGKMIAKGSTLLQLSSDMNHYDRMISEAQEAASYGLKGHDCSIRYSCDDNKTSKA